MSSSNVIVVSTVECMFLKQHVKYVQLVVLQQHSLFVLIALLPCTSAYSCVFSRLSSMYSSCTGTCILDASLLICKTKYRYPYVNVALALLVLSLSDTE